MNSAFRRARLAAKPTTRRSAFCRFVNLRTAALVTAFPTEKIFCLRRIAKHSASLRRSCSYQNVKNILTFVGNVSSQSDANAFSASLDVPHNIQRHLKAPPFSAAHSSLLYRGSRINAIYFFGRLCPQNEPSGQSPQRGLRAVHTSRPKSTSRWQKSA